MTKQNQQQAPQAPKQAPKPQQTKPQQTAGPQTRPFDPTKGKTPQLPITVDASKADASKANGTEDAANKIYRWTPLGETEEVLLSINMVRYYLCQPTKDGHWPNDAEVMKYMMVCRQRLFNPWVGDCWLLGYDTKAGPKFSIVVAVQALLKRTEISPQFDGIETGVIVALAEGDIIEREGDITFRGEELLGGWAKVFRRDRSRPFYQRIKAATYYRETTIWKNDTAGMIVKCALSAALREAFPSDIGGLYLEQEMVEAASAAANAAAHNPAQAQAAAQTAQQQLKERFAAAPAHKEAAKETVVGKTTPAETASQARQEAPGEHDQTGESEGGNGEQDETVANGGDQGGDSEPAAIDNGVTEDLLGDETQPKLKF